MGSDEPKYPKTDDQTCQSPFGCPEPNCTKAFRRKEHLNRHIRGHNASRPFKCYICNRSFARKDILNRHVLQHNVPAESPKRTSLACETCRKRKIKCDSKKPCSACIASKTQCVRRTSSMQASSSNAQQGGHSNLPFEEDDQDDSMEASEGDFDDEINSSGSDDDVGLSNRDSIIAEEETRMEFRSPETGLEITETQAPTTGSSVPGSGSTLPSTDTPPTPISNSAELELSTWMTSFHDPLFSQYDSLLPQLDLFKDSQEYPLFQATETDVLFYKEWPIVHFPTLSVEKAHPTLIQSLASFSNWVRQEDHKRPNYQSVNEMITEELLSDSINSRLPRQALTIHKLQILQAITINILHVLVCDISKETLAWVARWSDMTISLLRHRGIFDGNWAIDEVFESEDRRWLMEDQIKRVALAVIRIDCYTSILTNRPPNLRFQELRLTLPNNDTFWNAGSAHERVSLQWIAPAGRSKRLLSDLMRDGLLKIGAHQIPIQLSLEDYHVGLCGFQGDVWTLSQEMRHHDSLTYKSPERQRKDEVRVWRGYLQGIRMHMELNHKLEPLFFGDDPSASSNVTQWCFCFAALNLTLYHILSINLLANTSMLEYGTCCPDCQNIGLESRIRAWCQSSDGRAAVLHAAQLRRVYGRECEMLTPAQWRMTNMLRCAGLFLSAIVVCSYSARQEGCMSCMGGAAWNSHFNSGASSEVAMMSANATPGVSIVELVQPELKASDALANWEHTGGMATLNGVSLCTCSLTAILNWYMEQLTTNLTYSQRLFNFVLTLKG